MTTLLAIAGGGALGALARYGLSNAIHAWIGRDFPYGTLGVNVLGCLAAGILYILLLERWAAVAEWRALLLIGFLGAFTTFSSFSVETLQLLEQSGAGAALLNVALSVVLCVGGCWAGIVIARGLG